MNSTTENFWEIWENFQWPDPAPVFYRAYYNDEGIVTLYTMEDLPGNYVEIDLDTFRRSFPTARVTNGKVVDITPTTIFSKLKPADTGTACDPRDICIVVSEEQPHIKWKLTHNATD